MRTNAADFESRFYYPTDPLQKGELFGWDSPFLQRKIGAYIETGIAALDGVKNVGTATSLGPIIRQDLNPQVYEVFVKEFPLIDLVPKRESNGLVDAFERQLTYSANSEDTPVTITETGTVTDDANSYIQDTCNIAVFATRRGASLKSIFGSRAAGPAIDVAGREVEGGLIKIAHDFQTEAFRMQNAVSSGASVGAAQNYGVYDATGFKGLRYITETMVPAGNIEQVDVTSFTAANNTVTDNVSAVVNAIYDLGGHPNMMFSSFAGREYLRKEAYAKTNFYVDAKQRVEVRPGAYLPTFTLGNGEDIPFYAIPGKSIGSYGIAGDGHTYIDIYIADMRFAEIVWLGGPTPTLIEVPLASDGTLRKLTIPYWMASLEWAVPAYIGKVRLKTA